jgi:prevent-host-death family protein
MWQVQQAKNKFSQLVDDAMQDGPQIITRHGVEVAVIISYSEYRKIAALQKNMGKSLTQFFRESPLVGEDLDFSRVQGGARVDLEL